jgi:hypothetical protein
VKLVTNVMALKKDRYIDSVFKTVSVPWITNFKKEEFFRNINIVLFNIILHTYFIRLFWCDITFYIFRKLKLLFYATHIMK